MKKRFVINMIRKEDNVFFRNAGVDRVICEACELPIFKGPGQRAHLRKAAHVARVKALGGEESLRAQLLARREAARTMLG